MSFPSRELDNWITTEPAEQPRIAPIKVSENVYDETKLDWRLRKAGIRDVEVALMVVHHWLLDEENGWRKGDYTSGERVANSLKTIRENRMRNK